MIFQDYQIKVITKTNQSAIVERTGSSFKIKLKSAPEKGKANQELIKLLAQEFKVAQSAIEIIKGLTSRKKLVRIYKP